MRRTAKQIEASRTNGARSHGPVTAEGKARSSRNAVTHGLTASVILLDNEDRAEFDRVVASYHETWQPADQRESDLVELLAADAWRLNRILSAEAGAIHNQIETSREQVNREWEHPAEQLHTDIAINTMLDRLDKYSRLESRIRRASERTAAQLRTLQADRRKREAAEQRTAQNEPENCESPSPQRLTVVPKSGPEPAQPAALLQDRPDAAVVVSPHPQ